MYETVCQLCSRRLIRDSPSSIYCDKLNMVFRLFAYHTVGTILRLSLRFYQLKCAVCVLQCLQIPWIFTRLFPLFFIHLVDQFYKQNDALPWDQLINWSRSIVSILWNIPSALLILNRAFFSNDWSFPRTLAR